MAAPSGDSHAREAPIQGRVGLSHDTEQEIAVDEVDSDFLLIRPSESILADGLFKGGYSAVDELMLASESLLVEKQSGDTIIGDMLNKSARSGLRRLSSVGTSALAQIITLVEDAQVSQVPIMTLTSPAIEPLWRTSAAPQPGISYSSAGNVTMHMLISGTPVPPRYLFVTRSRYYDTYD